MDKDKENDYSPLKLRSSRACIRDGYRFYAAGFRQIFKNTWLIACCFALLSATASALPVLFSPALLLPSLALAVLAVILLLWAGNRRLKKRNILVLNEKVKFKYWMRHLGKLIIVTIVCLFIVAMLSLLTSLPTVIIMAANWQSQMGVLSGDPSGMPEYVLWLSVVAFIIAGFIQAYVWMTTLGPAYFLRGSIIQHEKEKKEFNTKKNEEIAIVYRS